MIVLHIDSSILGDASVSRTLSAAVVARLRKETPALTVIYRDLAREPLPLFSGALAAALRAGLPREQQSDQVQHDVAILSAVLEEVLSADVIVIGAPMYNFTVPSQLKTWIDALTVPGKTFRHTSNGFEGLLGDKRVIVASSRGGVYGPQTPMASFEHQESYLQSIFDFLGVRDLQIIRAEGVNVSQEVRERALQTALQQVAEDSFAVAVR